MKQFSTEDTFISVLNPIDITNKSVNETIRMKDTLENDMKTPKTLRKEVVRYVEIPSSFPHFPRLTELYNSNQKDLSEMWGKSHARLPITDQNKVITIYLDSFWVFVNV